MAKWALIIAIQDYPNMSGSLDKKLPDANETAEEFLDWVTRAKSVPATNIVACAGMECSWRTTGTTRGEIVGAFTNIVTKSRENADELYVFFSGHGIGFSEDPNDPAIDILVGSEFTNSAASGGACLRFQEVKERLRMALGPGKHFYFIDACRNPMKQGEIRPAIVDVVWGRSLRANATTYVLFSTAPGDVAKVSSGFGKALLKALKGAGRAKTWVGGKMYVTFDALCSYIQRALNKNDLDPEKKGPGDGNIVEIQPVPTSNCEVEVIDASANDTFLLQILDIRQGRRGPVNFRGRNTRIPLPPEDYLLNLTTTAGQAVAQINPPVSNDGVDLYEDGKVEFQMNAPGAPLSGAPISPASLRSSVRVLGIPKTDLLLHDLADDSTVSIPFGTDEIVTSLKPGSYKAYIRDGNFDLATKNFRVPVGSDITLDFKPTVAAGAHQSLSSAIPTHGPLVNFSETLSGIPDWNLSLWLAVLGASRILAAPDTFSKLRELKLETFEQASPTKSVLFLLSGEQDTSDVPVWAMGQLPEWKPMQPVEGLAGLFQQKIDFEPGPILVSYGLGRQSVTIQSYGLPNRATFLTFANSGRGGRQVQQFIFPIHSLFGQISELELDYLTNLSEPLPRVRYMSTAQRLFAAQSPIEGQIYKQSDRYWFDLLYHKWLDPIMAIIACYEVIRRGAVKEQMSLMKEVLSNMRSYFPGIPDTEVIAKLLGEPSTLSSVPPLLLDGLMAISMKSSPLPKADLEFSGIWTAWRDAFPLPGATVTAQQAAAI
jgi:hypothetical protein